MSHFTVLVIGENVEEQLARFEEDTENLPKEWLEFQDKEDEYLQKYENETIEMKHLPDGSLVYSWDRQYVLPKKSMLEKDEYSYPEGTRDITVALNVLFNTFEDYMKEFCGYPEGRDPETNRYGYWDNPKAKWDWYQVGGRWNGFFKLKNGALGKLGNPGCMTTPCEDDTYADVALKKDIDWKTMIDEHLAKELETRKVFLEIVNGREVPKWNDIREKYSNIDDARNEYSNNEVVKELHACRDYMFGWTNPDKEYFEYFLLPEKEFVVKASKGAISTFAVVKNGEWYERGEMGWWGIVSDEEDIEGWSERWYNLVMSVDDNTTLTIVDCHI